ncbi:hypothetical protein ABR157_003352 [Enterobacter soli]
MLDDKKEPKGKAKGGVARAKSLTKEQRSEIAKKGAAARWKDKPLKATHKGNFQEAFGIDVECYVLDDENKTPVISKRGMAEALGMSEGGTKLTRFLSGKTISNYLGPELSKKSENPIIFQWNSSGQPASVVHGYDVTILIDICRAILKAKEDKKLMSNQETIAKQAQIIVSASAKAGIRGLAYAVAGYRPEVQEVINAFKAFVREEARQYEKEFPDELYEEWYRLYKLNRPEKGRPIRFGQLTNMQIYAPLAKSKGKILEQIRTSRDENGKQSDKLHLFLSEIGVKALRQHIGKLLGVAAMSDNKEEYEAGIEKVLGRMKPEL